MPISAYLLPLTLFAAAASFTPGPNNTLLMASGARWGVRRTLPFLSGVVFGFAFMLFAVGLGLGAAFRAWPLLHAVLKVACFGFLLVLAWKVARSGSPGADSGKEKPSGFWLAAGFQWINPKGWMMAVSAQAVYVPEGEPALPHVATIVAVFFLTGIASALAWCVFGTAFSGFLDRPRRVRVFNIAMAVLLVVSMLPALF